MVGDEASDWRAEQRVAIEEVFATARPSEPTHHLSPSKKYELSIVKYEPDQGWNFTEGIVTHAGDGSMIAVVHRNIGAFLFAWCEGHPTGHDYLIAGEDYQGQTIIELDTGGRVDYLPDSAEEGHGFCWTEVSVAPGRDFIAVGGCYWAGPYELVVYDFSDPMHPPYPELHRWNDDLRVVDGFDEHGRLSWTFDRTVRRVDGVPTASLSEAEERALFDERGGYRDGAVVVQTCRAHWQVGTPLGSVEIETWSKGLL